MYWCKKLSFIIFWSDLGAFRIKGISGITGEVQVAKTRKRREIIAPDLSISLDDIYLLFIDHAACYMADNCYISKLIQRRCVCNLTENSIPPRSQEGIMKTLQLLFGLLLILIFTTCSSAVEQPSVNQRLTAMGLQLGEGNMRIPGYRINDWTRVDDRKLVITSGVNDKYLVRLHATCINLDSAFSIGFTTPTGGLSSGQD